MSLFATMVDQVTRPSFLPVYQDPTRRPPQPVATEKRRQVLACLRTAGKPVSASWVIAYTGYTKQSVNHILYKLEDEGIVKRKESDGDRVPGITHIRWVAEPEADK